MSKYDDALKALDADSAEKRSAAGVAASAFQPDAYAKALDLSRETDAPASIIARDPKPFEEKAARTKYDAALQGAPALSSFLESVDNHAVARDDVENLSLLEKAIRKITGAAKTAALGATLIERQFVKPIEIVREIPSGFVQGGGMALSGAGRMLEMGGRATESLVRGAGADWLADLQVDSQYTPGGYLRSVGEPLEQLAQTIQTPQERRTLITEGVQGLGQIGSQALIQWLTGPIGSGITLFGQGADVMGDRADIVIANAKEAGASPEELASLQRKADFATTVGAAWTALTEKYQLDDLMNRAPLSVRSKFMSEVGDFLLAGLGEGVQETTEAIGHDTIAKLTFDPSTQIGGSAAEEGAAAFLSGALSRLVLNAIIPGRGAAFTDDHRAVAEEINTIVAKSKLAQRSPQKVEELVAEIKKQTGSETAYLDAEAFRTLYQSDQEAAQAAAELTGSQTAYFEAAVSGSKIAVPLEKYVARIATSPNAAKLVDHITFTPDGLTAAEVQASLEGFDERVQSLQETMQKESADPSTPIYEDVFGQLLATGMERSTAEKNATLMQAVFRTLAQRADMDPMALYDKYGLGIRRDMPDLMSKPPSIDATIDPLLDRLRAGDIPSQQQAFGPSLIEFIRSKGGIVDEGGELAARDIDKGNKPFQRNVIQKEGLTLDDMAEQLVENGYINERDPNLVLDLISKELGGQPVFAAGSENAALVGQLEQLKWLEEFIGKSGLDLKTADNATIKKALAAQSEPVARKPFDLDAVEDALIEERVRNTEDRGMAPNADSPAIERAIYDATVASTLPGSSAETAALFDVAMQNGRLDLAEYIVARAERFAATASTTPGVNVDSPKYAAIKETLENRKAVESSAAAELRSKLTETALAAQQYEQAAFHGSPFDFHRFDLSKIGTGEGAQAYGWGQYFADAKDVAENYRVNLTSRKADRVKLDGAPVAGDSMLSRSLEDMARFGKSYAIQRLDDNIKFNTSYAPDIAALYSDVKRKIEATDESKVSVDRGQLFAVDIPDAAVAKMLDWDKPLSEQPEAVRKAVDDLLAGTKFATEGIRTGKDAYQFIGFRTRKKYGLEEWQGDVAASRYLGENGVPGLRYLDGGSRGSGDGTRNTVVWDQSLLDEISAGMQKTFFQSSPAATQTDTPAFKQWFGESKVVDDKGEPLVVYHGTKSPGFDTFNTRGETTSSGDDFKFSPLGAWFTDAPRVANNFATDFNGTGRDGAVMPVYVALRKPFEISYDDLNAQVANQRSARALRSNLEADGYDGMKVGRYGGAEGFDYVAFRPNQIKSATGNSGAFDAGNPNILFQSGKGAGQTFDMFSATGQPTAEAIQPIVEVSPPKAAEVSPKAPAKSGPIQDFGAKLEGARKDAIAAMTRDWTDADIATQSLSKIWPASEVDAIEDKYVAAVAFAARQEIPAKPKVSYKLKRYVEAVKLLRGLASSMMSGSVSRDVFEAKLKQARGLENFGSKLALLESIDRDQWKRIGSVSEHPDAYRYDENGKQVLSPFVAVEIDDKRHLFGGSKSIADVIESVNEKLGVAQQAKLMQFEVRGRTGSYSINKKGDREYRKLKTFETAKEALDFVKSNNADLVKLWDGIKDKFNVQKADVRSDENRPRTAKDYRQGRDISPDEFQQTFGFRGGQFGNWVSQGNNTADRQWMLNSAYDGLMDLSDILNVPPRALSLNGDLGISFGARGHGAASAHYEPDTLIINLTKTRGAGTLAHEWFHALDNYFQRQRGVGKDRQGRYITYAPEAYYENDSGIRLPAAAFEEAVSHEKIRNFPGGPDANLRRIYRYQQAIGDKSQWTKKDSVRPAVEERFAQLVKALNDSPMKGRSELIDAGKDDGYWSRIIERGARSFENYVIAKMAEKGYQNDYLANVTRPEDFSRDVGRYPYLMDDEIGPVAEAFDNLFATIETKETDKGLMFFQRFEETKRGAITFGADRRFTISLLEKADLSTFLHESGHLYLELLADLAEQPDAPQQIKDDYAAVLKWLGVKDRASVGVDQHEQWARGFESYLMEGKAPTVELQTAFARFRAWLVGIYRTLKKLNVTLTDDVRKVMDRLVATDAEIAAAEESQNYAPIFATAEEAGMSIEEWAVYKDIANKAHQESVTDLADRAMRELTREQKAWWKEEREAAIQSVTDEVNAMPVYRALAFLQRGQNSDGTALPEGITATKLSKSHLVDAYGKDFLKRLPRPYVYTAEGGISSDVAAQMFGFDSGPALVEALANARPKLQLIEMEADARLREKYGDMLTDGSIADQALHAVHTNEREKVLAAELKALNRKRREVAKFVNAADRAKAREQKQAREANPLPDSDELKVIKAAVERIIAVKRVREIQPNVYRVAEAQSAKAAFDFAAKGKYEDAYTQKRRQILNHELYKAAVKAKEEVEAITEYMRGFDRKATRERLARAKGQFLEQIDALRERFDFTRISNIAAQKRIALAEWVKEQEEAGREIDIPAELLNETRRISYKELALWELQGLKDAVANIDHVARTKDKLLKNKAKAEWQDAKAELLERVKTALPEGKDPPIGRFDLTSMDDWSAKVRGLADSFLRPETIIEWLDGGRQGPWHDYLWNQADDSQAKREQLREQVLKPLYDLAQKINKTRRNELQEFVQIKSMGRGLNRRTLISIAMNMGNASNIERLLKGGYKTKDGSKPFTQQNLDEIRNALTKADWEFVQTVWDTVEGLWPETAEFQKRMGGLVPEKVQAVPIQTKFGTYKGGYFPVVYDPDVTKAGEKQASGDSAQEIMGKDFTKATTKKGHLKGRTAVAGPLLLDFERVMTRHMDHVITDLSHREFLLQALKILDDKDLRAQVQSRLSDTAYRSLQGMVRHAVRADHSFGEVAASGWDRITDRIISNTAVAALGFRATTSFGNLVLAPVQAGARVSPKFILKGTADFYKSPKASTEFIHARSSLMKNRATNMDATFVETLTKLRGEQGIKAQVARASMSVHRWADFLSTHGIWLGRYQQSLQGGATEEQAVRDADSAIRQTQTAGAPKDLSAWERDPRFKLFRMFIGPMVIMGNRIREAGARRGVVQNWPEAFGTMLAVWFLPAVLWDLVTGRGPDDDDDDGMADDLSAYAMREIAFYPFLTVPLLRDAADYLERKVKGDYAVPRTVPIFDAMTMVANAGEEALKASAAVYEGESVDTEALVKDSLRAAGPLFGLPTSQLTVTGTFLHDVATGAYDPEGVDDLRYLLIRRPE
jgi:hypothetical protein